MSVNLLLRRALDRTAVQPVEYIQPVVQTTFTGIFQQEYNSFLMDSRTRPLDLLKYRWEQHPEEWFQAQVFDASLWAASYQQEGNSFLTASGPKIDTRWRWDEPIEPLTATFQDIQLFWTAADAETKSFRVLEGQRLDLRSYEWIQHPELYASMLGLLFNVITQGAGIWSQQFGSFQTPQYPQFNIRNYIWRTAGAIDVTTLFWQAAVISQQAGSFLTLPKAKLLLQFYEWIQRDEAWKSALDAVSPLSPAWMELLQSFLTEKARGRDPAFDQLQQIGWWSPILPVPTVTTIFTLPLTGSGA